MNYISTELDEDYCLRLPCGGQLDIPFYGLVIITYEDDDWRIVDISLSASRQTKSPPSSETWLQTIPPASPMFGIIANYMVDTRSEEIEKLIREDKEARVESRLFDEGKEISKMRGTA